MYDFSKGQEWYQENISPTSAGDFKYNSAKATQTAPCFTEANPQPLLGADRKRYGLKLKPGKMHFRENKVSIFNFHLYLQIGSYIHSFTFFFRQCCSCVLYASILPHAFTDCGHMQWRGTDCRPKVKNFKISSENAGHTISEECVSRQFAK